jgi:hypothetical protein
MFLREGAGGEPRRYGSERECALSSYAFFPSPVFAFTRTNA